MDDLGKGGVIIALYIAAAVIWMARAPIVRAEGRAATRGNILTTRNTSLRNGAATLIAPMTNAALIHASRITTLNPSGQQIET